MDHILINPQFAKEMKIYSRFKKIGVDLDFIEEKESLDFRLGMLSPYSFTHMGSVFSKQGLKHNILIADPTYDKELIDFAINLPENQFVRNGKEKRLLIHAMKELFPEKILAYSSKRGKQAIDWRFRIEENWEWILYEFKRIGTNDLEKKYLNLSIIHDLISAVEEKGLHYADQFFLTLLFRALIFSKFLQGTQNGELFH